jgi:hypothetical protein
MAIQRDNALSEGDRMRAKRADMLAELASVDAVIESWDEAAEVFGRRLRDAGWPYPMVDIADEPETELPLERAAHEAHEAAMAAHAGRDPYGLTGTQFIPPVNGSGDAPASSSSSELPKECAR